MTRQLRLAPSKPAGNEPVLRRLAPARNLTEEVVDQLTAEIRGGRLSPGARLPTEQELMTALGVSRTVVREAIAAMRSEGLVVTRQGSGAYVATDTSRIPFRIAGLDDAATIADVIDVMELRLAVEVEAAALAAERAGAAQLTAMRRAFEAIERAVGRGEGAVKEDFDFHRAIADAAGNPHFPQFLEFLGRHVIPRQSIRRSQGTPPEQRRYLETLQKEHRRIADAILTREPQQARRAMRAHLSNSLERYRRIAEEVRSAR